MGLFERLTTPDEPSPGSRYLASLTRGPRGEIPTRKTLLCGACFSRIASLPVASAEAFGRPIADTFELVPATSVVMKGS